MLCSVADSEAKLLPSGMNEDSHSPSCSYPGGSRRAPPRSVLRQRPLGNFLQRRAPAARDAFPETEIMFPLLPDSRMDAWSGGYPLDSPPDSLRRRSANGRTQGPSSARTGSSAARNRTSHDGGSRQGSQRRHAARDAGARRSVSSGFFKRIFRGTPRKYSEEAVHSARTKDGVREDPAGRSQQPRRVPQQRAHGDARRGERLVPGLLPRLGATRPPAAQGRRGRQALPQVWRHLLRAWRHRHALTSTFRNTR
ncbi:uncharacterized protein [Dermacentor andersoni]|uniref:uncharacterized protein isoform X3 n=1 Tax=Dermacentor andersoni TaxID=34620 RepID=UPI002155F390|nr:uncharacterized protein LOC126522837 isoform X3 [Dermacentor andersoni]